MQNKNTLTLSFLTQCLFVFSSGFNQHVCLGEEEEGNLDNTKGIVTGNGCLEKKTTHLMIPHYLTQPQQASSLNTT